MYDLILINPRSIFYTKAQSAAPYLYAGLLSIGSFAVARGYRTRILDMVVEEDPQAALARTVGDGAQGRPLFGISAMTSQVPHAARLSRYIRRTYPEARIVWGGIHASLYPEDVLREGVADCVCVGEGEHTTVELLDALRRGGDAHSVRGLCVPDGAGFIETGTRPPAPLDDMPFLDYGLLDYDRYRDRNVFRGEEATAVRFGTVVTSFGCPYRCSFCINSNPRLFHGKYRRKSPRRIADEIEHLIGRHGINYFDFVDENFFVDRSHIEDFAEEIERRRLSFGWFTNIRADAFSRGIVDEALMRRLARVGLHRLGIGAESGSQAVLDKLCKDTRVEQISEAAAIITRCGVGVSCSFMMGIPGEKREDLLATLALISRLRKLGRTTAIIGPQVFRPYPGGALYEECINRWGYLPPRTLAEWEAAVDLLTGYESVARHPWVEDPKFLERIAFYVEYANLSIAPLKAGPVKRAGLHAMKALAGARLRLGMWGFPIEKTALLFAKNLRRRIGASG